MARKRVQNRGKLGEQGMFISGAAYGMARRRGTNHFLEFRRRRRTTRMDGWRMEGGPRRSMGSLDRGLLGYDGNAFTTLDPRDSPIGERVFALMVDEDDSL